MWFLVCLSVFFSSIPIQKKKKRWDRSLLFKFKIYWVYTSIDILSKNLYISSFTYVNEDLIRDRQNTQEIIKQIESSEEINCWLGLSKLIFYERPQKGFPYTEHILIKLFWKGKTKLEIKKKEKKKNNSPSDLILEEGSPSVLSSFCVVWSDWDPASWKKKVSACWKAPIMLCHHTFLDLTRSSYFIVLCMWSQWPIQFWFSLFFSVHLEKYILK